jgi:hypothetical protein
MDQSMIARIYSNTIAMGYIPPSKMDDFKAARERGDAANTRPFHVDIRGTGFMIGPGLAVTAAHVVDWFTKMRIADENAMLCSVEERGSQGVRHWFIPWTRQSYVSRMTRPEVELSRTDRLEVHPDTDMAVFTLPFDPARPSPQFSGIPGGDCRRLSVGDDVYVAGYPLGQRLMDLPGTATMRLGPLFLRGQVAAITPIGLSWHEHADGFLIDVTAARALSGGPVCNSEGQVIGIFTGGVEKEESVIDPATKKPIDGHVVPIPYSIGRVIPIHWGFIQTVVDTLLARGLAVDDRKRDAPEVVKGT